MRAVCQNHGGVDFIGVGQGFNWLHQGAVVLRIARQYCGGADFIGIVQTLHIVRRHYGGIDFIGIGQSLFLGTHSRNSRLSFHGEMMKTGAYAACSGIWRTIGK